MFTQIVVPVDLSDRHQAALDLAAWLVERNRGEVTLLHIIEVIPELIVTGMEVRRLSKASGLKHVQARVNGQMRDFRAEEILMAVGRVPQTAKLRLDTIGVEKDHGRVKINDYRQTTQPHIYAGGDVSGPLLFTHVAPY